MRIYPPYIPSFPNEPTKEDFLIAIVDQNVGWGIYSRKPHLAGTELCAFSGVIMSEITQYTLQVNRELHMHDPYFTGLLTHSCDPNAQLDMQNLKLVALKNIAPGELLTIDYDHTEEYLFKGFDCSCGAPTCKGFIQGFGAERQLVAVNY